MEPGSRAPNNFDKTSVKIKELLAKPFEVIQLHDLVNGLLRKTLEKLNDKQHFSTNGNSSNEEFTLRIQRYEEAISELTIATALLGRWASGEQLSLLDSIFERMAESERPDSGSVVWLRLHWYPVLVLMYAAGIAALAGRNYASLRSALLTPVYTRQTLRGHDKSAVVLPVILELTEIVEVFKKLPGMDRRYTPCSDHLYEALRPIMEDQFFLGRKYDELFDEFEMILALTFADLRDDVPAQHIWGPPGRFAWKESGRSENAVFTKFVDRIEARGQDWDLLKFGFFRGSSDRFSEVAGAYKDLLKRVNWW